MSDHIPTQQQTQEIPYGYCHCGCGQKTSIAKITDPRRGNVKGQPVMYVSGHNAGLRRLPVDLPDLAPGTRAIQLTHGKVAIVDEDDFEKLSKYRWHAVLRKQTWYAARKESGICHYMHRDIIGATVGAPVDHIDGNGLNNVRSNLRMATFQQNCYNKRSMGGKSKYKGVTYCTDTDMWRARIRKDNRTVNIGRFDSEHDAARAYDEMARQLFGEFAWVNFPLPEASHA